MIKGYLTAEDNKAIRMEKRYDNSLTPLENREAKVEIVIKKNKKINADNKGGR